MPNNLTDTEENRLLDLSLVNGDLMALLTVAGTDAALGTEVVGGTYARQGVTWAAAAGGSKSNSAEVSFPGMLAMDVQGWAIFSADGAQRKWYGLFSRFTATATAATDIITAAGHGLADGAKVVFQNGYVPAGLAASTTYYVRDATTSTFKVSASLGGAAINITADSSLAVVGKVLEAISGAAVSVAAGSLTCTLS